MIRNLRQMIACGVYGSRAFHLTPLIFLNAIIYVSDQKKISFPYRYGRINLKYLRAFGNNIIIGNEYVNILV